MSVTSQTAISLQFVPTLQDLMIANARVAFQEMAFLVQVFFFFIVNKFRNPIRKEGRKEGRKEEY